MRAEPGPADASGPFERRADGWWLEEFELARLVRELSEFGERPARLLSRAAVDAVLAAEGPRTLGLDALEDPDLLRLAADAGWWARVRSRHELDSALGLGFPGERLVAAGPVVDDGFLKEALVAQVAVLELGEAERANAARIAELLELPLPDSDATPPPAASGTVFGGCGGFLAAVLAPPPDLQLDMPWPLGVEHVDHPGSAAAAPAWERAPHEEPLEVFVVVGESAEAEPAHTGLRFLSRDAGNPLPRTARLHGAARRGDRVLLPSAAAVVRCWVDPVHEAVPGVLVSGRSWRLLAPRALPPREPAG